MKTREFCVNYNGAFNDRCRADITYRDVEREPMPGDTSRLDRMPCFEEEPSLSVPCQQRRFKTAQERAERERAIKEHLEQFFGAIERGECPDCRQPMTKQQVGPCVYAAPCGHRLYQGRVT